MTRMKILGVAMGFAFAVLLGGCERGGQPTQSQTGAQQGNPTNNASGSGSQQANPGSNAAATGTQPGNPANNAAANGSPQENAANNGPAAGTPQDNSANNAAQNGAQERNSTNNSAESGNQPGSAVNTAAASGSNETKDSDQKGGSVEKTQTIPSSQTADKRINARRHKRLYSFQPAYRCRFLRREGRRLPKNCR